MTSSSLCARLSLSLRIWTAISSPLSLCVSCQSIYASIAYEIWVTWRVIIPPSVSCVCVCTAVIWVTECVCLWVLRIQPGGCWHGWKLLITISVAGDGPHKMAARVPLPLPFSSHTLPGDRFHSLLVTHDASSVGTRWKGRERGTLVWSCCCPGVLGSCKKGVSLGRETGFSANCYSVTSKLH